MKKFFVIVMAVCLMTVTLCVTAFAAGSDTVALRVSALKKDGSTVFINEYSDLAEGWNQAIALANDGNEMKKNEYDRIVIDPKPVAGVTSASGWVDTPKGRVCVSWKLSGRRLVVEKSVPPGITLVSASEDRPLF